tara:strand:- start:1193 stop:1834 length:642 start_codon:yes stop_codon:yes gene_type:complete
MSEIEYEVDHVKHSVGGRSGHIFRRFFHMSMAAIPWLYYVHGEALANIVSLTPIQFVSLFGVVAIIFEIFRMKFGILIVGQREYEKHQTSALAWGAVSIALTIIALSPWEGSGDTHAGWLTIPIILSLTFGDPAMGEARRMGLDDRMVYAIGTIICGLIWLGCGYFLGTPYWMALLMGPLTMAAELPKLKWIDDNATMLLIPVAAVLMIVPFL